VRRPPLLGEPEFDATGVSSQLRGREPPRNPCLVGIGLGHVLEVGRGRIGGLRVGHEALGNRVAVVIPGDGLDVAVAVSDRITPVDQLAASGDGERAFEAVAAKAIKRKTGARGLRSIMENILLDPMYDLPGMTGVEEVVVNKDAVETVFESRLVRAPAPLQAVS